VERGEGILEELLATYLLFFAIVLRMLWALARNLDDGTGEFQCVAWVVGLLGGLGRIRWRRRPKEGVVGRGLYRRLLALRWSAGRLCTSLLPVARRAASAVRCAGGARVLALSALFKWLAFFISAHSSGIGTVTYCHLAR
jgi:hypothetical protein